jgi:hypothetical protein
MKTQLAILGLLAVPCLAFAQKPAGVLGVNNVYAYGMYETMDTPDSGSFDYDGVGLGISQNLFENEKCGMDAGFNFEYWKNVTDKDQYSYISRSYTGSVTGYMKGTFSPFVTAMLNWSNVSGLGYKGYESTWGAVKIGGEWHVAAGWYITPSLTYWGTIDSDDDSSDTEWDYGIETGYWFTERFLGFVNANYSTDDGYDQYWMNLGVAYRY